MPVYVADQQRIASKPYTVTLPGIDGLEFFYFRDLGEVDTFLKIKGKSLLEIELLPDFLE